MKKYALFIGRWQTWHAGHRWLIDQQLNKGKNVWLAVRDVEQDENNPKTAHQVVDNLKIELLDLLHTGKLFISIIPDIESVNYGRYVGYDVIYHEPPPEVGSISGTAIREGKIDQDGTSKETHS
jgi:nicotinamide mononucleotide adenylyltransferase